MNLLKGQSFLQKCLNKQPPHGTIKGKKNKSRAKTIHDKEPNPESFLSSPGLLGYEKPHAHTRISIQSTDTTRDHRIFVATWNVAGIYPAADLNLDDWLDMREPADIYVLGFQEIVPLNAGNVLYAKDGGASALWEALIGRTLNKALAPAAESSLPCKSVPRMTDSNHFSLQSVQRIKTPWRVLHHNSAVGPDSIHSPSRHYSERVVEFHEVPDSYIHIAGKQLVGIYLTIWIQKDLHKAVGNLEVSCVSLGLMGFLGNKGSISISMSLHQTSFCFVCSHLTSGEKEEDRLHRNAEVAKILCRTYFPNRVYYSQGSSSPTPQSIMAHEKVIWFGDLNYRLCLNLNVTMALLRMGKLEILLENDQLKLEQKAGNVFDGWNEGLIDFAPTYKYELNTNCYTKQGSKHGQKCRTPAWCDRILWTGKGMRQIAYGRSELLCSDHRPVMAIFLAAVKVNPDKEQLY